MDIMYCLAEWQSSPYIGKVRLVGGKISSEGFIEVYAGNNSWYKMCGSFGLKEGNAACKQLGYSGITASLCASFKR